MVSNIETGAIEILNLESYERSYNLDQPSILLHGLAHALYYSFTVNEQFDIEQTYRSAIFSGKYDDVINYFGQRGAHYAKKNGQTYFAECTEAYFSWGFKFAPAQTDLIRYLKTDFSAEYQSHSYRNDYQPFTKSQLMVRMRPKCCW